MDWSKFFHMGGYGFYVWGSYGLALVALGSEVLVLARRKKALSRRATPLFKSAVKDHEDKT